MQFVIRSDRMLIVLGSAGVDIRRRDKVSLRLYFDGFTSTNC